MLDGFSFKKKENAAAKKPNLKEYTDTSGAFSNRSLTLAEWYLKHQVQLSKLLIWFLATLNIFLLGFSLYGWGRYFFFDYTETEQLLYDLTRPNAETQRYLARSAPRDLEIKSVAVFDDGPGKYDFIARISNPNRIWKALVTYQFFYSGGKTETDQVLVLPLSELAMTRLGEASASYPSSVSVEIVDITWQRLDPHMVSDTVAYLQERVNFEVSNFEFLPARKSEGIFVHTISFDIKNNSVYSYWQPYFYVMYKDNRTPVGIARVEIDRFKNGETRKVEIKSLSESLRVTELEVLPELDIFDTSVYIAPGL